MLLTVYLTCLKDASHFNCPTHFNTFSIFCFVVFFFFLNNTISNTRAPITTTAPAIPPMMPPRSGPLIVDEDDADAIVLLRSVGGDVPVEFD